MARPEVLIVGENEFPFHRIEEIAPEIERAVGDAVETTVTTDRGALTDLAGYDAVIDYLTDSTLTADQLDGLLSFVEGGGGYLGVHCASDLTSMNDGDGGIESRDEPVAELHELIGGYFLTHPEQSTFGVTITDDYPVTAGVDDFEVFDEPYQVDYDADQVHVLARLEHPDLESYPVVWIRTYGEGRVCYSSLGHTAESFKVEEHRSLLRNAVRWVTDS